MPTLKTCDGHEAAAVVMKDVAAVVWSVTTVVTEAIGVEIEATQVPNPSTAEVTKGGGGEGGGVWYDSSRPGAMTLAGNTADGTAIPDVTTDGSLPGGEIPLP